MTEIVLLYRTNLSYSVKPDPCSLGPTALFVGLAILVMLLPRSGVIPRWVALETVVGMILIGVGSFILDDGGVVVFGFAVMCAGFVLIGLRVLSRSVGDW